MAIYELLDEDTTRIKEIVHLHKKSFPSFFLTQLGSTFLKTLYKGYLDDKESGIIIAEEKGQIQGFIAFSKDYSKFYKGLIKHKIFQFALCSVLATIRHPSYAKRLLGAFKKSDVVAKNVKYVELASICVAPLVMGHGVGTKLIDYLKSITDFETYAYINLETDADNNDAANMFYKKNKFILFREYITTEGRRMNEYRYNPMYDIK